MYLKDTAVCLYYKFKYVSSNVNIVIYASGILN